MKAQGYDLSKNIIYQDNQSAICMEKNGRNSCTGNSRHINVRYFFIKDRIQKKEVTVKYCPTYIMPAYYFTKALQGKLFTQLRDTIMGKISVYKLAEMNIGLEERVENSFLEFVYLSTSSSSTDVRDGTQKQDS